MTAPQVLNAPELLSETMTFKELNSVQQQLVESAIQARLNAYAPYSKYLVGAALLADGKKIIMGCNVENASYGLGICAERAAIFKGISNGDKGFSSIAIVTLDGGMPCGACRQVLNEFNSNMEVIVSDNNKENIHIMSLKFLLPRSFGPSNL